MTTHAFAVAAGLILSLLGSATNAAAAVSEGASRLAFIDAPPPAPRAPGPAPLREEDEYGRRTWEAFPTMSLDTPFCRGDALGSSHCGDTETGTSLGGGALYRLTPYVGIGAAASFTSFGKTGAEAFSHARWFGVIVRGYFLDRGAFDPYVEAGLGAGSVSSGESDGIHGVALRASGPASTAAVGIDFWVLPCLRLGPALAYRWTWLTRVERCVDGACTAGDVSSVGAVGSHLSLGVVATFAIGAEM
jgi:hypothetical protein